MVSARRVWRTPLFWAFLLGLLYLLTRLTNLTLLPIFTDEAIYIRWSQIGSRDANWRFISLTDGKQPMFTWIMMVLLKFIPDPLFAGRLVSVLAGLGSMVGLWFLTHELFRNKKTAFLVSFVYLVSPFALLYDRMALYDSLVATFSIWNVYLAILLVRRLRLDIALLFGMMLGAGMLNKSSGFLSLYMLPLTLLLFDWNAPNRLKRLGMWVGLSLVAAFLSQALYGVLRLSPLSHIVAQKDAVFVYPFSEWIKHPVLFLQGNFRGQFDWLIGYLSWPIMFASFLPLLTIWHKFREKLLLYAWWLVPFFALAMFGRILYPRFILFMVMPLFVLAGTSIYEVIRRWGKTYAGVILVIILFFQNISTGYFIITNPLHAQIPRSDKGQYVDDWPSGWGVREVIAFLTEEASSGRVSVYTEGTFGLLPHAIEISLVDHPNVSIRGIYPLPESMPPEMLESARDHPTYFVLNQTQVPPDWPLEFIAEYQKGNRKDRKLRFYKVTSTSPQKLARALFEKTYFPLKQNLRKIPGIGVL